MKYILITGVSTGIGHDATRYLLDEGYFVFGSVRKQADADRLQQEFGERFQPLIFDVSDNDAIQKAVPLVEKKVGSEGLAGLINNAGIAYGGPLQHIPMEEFEHQFEVNVFGVMRVTQAFLPLLGAKESVTHPPGKIINISSVSGIFTVPFVGAYCSSKFALESLSDALRRELLMFGIDVIVLQPGPVQTPIWAKAKANDNRYENTAYAKVFNKLDRLIGGAEKRALPVAVISKRIHQVLKAKRPQTRYILHSNKFGTWFISKLPDRIVDYFIKRGLRKVFNG